MTLKQIVPLTDLESWCFSLLGIWQVAWHHEPVNLVRSWHLVAWSYSYVSCSYRQLASKIRRARVERRSEVSKCKARPACQERSRVGSIWQKQCLC